MNILDRLGEYQEQSHAIEAIEASALSAKARRALTVETIKLFVESGQTTNDPLLDLCILCWRDVAGQRKPQLEHLLEQIMPFPNQMVLLVTHSEMSAGCTGFGSKGQMQIVTGYSLGLQGESPNLVRAKPTADGFGSDSTVGLAVERSATQVGIGSLWRVGYIWARTDQALVPHYWGNLWPALEPKGLLDEQLEFRAHQLNNSLHRDPALIPFELVVGDAAVEAWFEDRSSLHSLDAARELIGYSKLTPALF